MTANAAEGMSFAARQSNGYHKAMQLGARRGLAVEGKAPACPTASPGTKARYAAAALHAAQWPRHRQAARGASAAALPTCGIHLGNHQPRVALQGTSAMGWVKVWADRGIV